MPQNAVVSDLHVGVNAYAKWMKYPQTPTDPGSRQDVDLEEKAYRFVKTVRESVEDTRPIKPKEEIRQTKRGNEYPYSDRLVFSQLPSQIIQEH
ncbi:hypothetical protein ACKWRH_28025 [Bradyrhizobium sp. Pa8]|uniref:hypothetical protein n=1 Tax=Bradyrhizobium sp. Pa8 TaxID=3386552 RepID=UPI00403F03A7